MQFPAKCGKHGLELFEFCDVDHENKMNIEQYDNLTIKQYDELHSDGRQYELNFDEGMKCDKGCVFTVLVKTKEQSK